LIRLPCAKPKLRCTPLSGLRGRAGESLDCYLKLACACVSFPMVSVHVGTVPEHAPLQLTNVAPAAGVAFSVTLVPTGNLAEQLPGQPINVLNAPFGVPLMLPLPLRPIDRLNT
jgi:hypothetical protein